MIKTVLFDIDDTLYSYQDADPVGMAGMDRYVTEHFSIPIPEFRKIYADCQLETETRLGINNAASHSRHIWSQEFLEKCHLPLFPHVEGLYEAYWGTILDSIMPNPGLTECLADLKESGIRVGISSNMTTSAQYRKLIALGAAPYIDFIVTSQEAGAEKPDPRFFAMCLAKAEAKPRECAVIGDDFQKDVLGACAADMHGIWYHPTKEDAEEDAKEMLPEQAASEISYAEVNHFSQIRQAIALFDR